MFLSYYGRNFYVKSIHRNLRLRLWKNNSYIETFVLHFAQTTNTRFLNVLLIFKL